jgi:hypothetical protein
MVAKITTPLSINRALNYNEQKVQKGKAECLFAGNFLHEANELNFYQKLGRFQQLIEQNTSKTNALHISLNFHPSENLSKEKLIQIAETYMGKIGFGEQPFLVYQHFDAGHPHLHIVTTSIRENGKRIDTYNIGKNQSQKARKEIEVAYGLMRAEGQLNQEKANVEPLNVQRSRYGLAETKRSISNVLSLIINQYKYTSIAELNAVLKLYNVTADQGSEESRTYKNKGLHYRLLDEKGNKIGVPIKASSIYFKPTLKYLEEKFTQNESLRLPFKSKLKTAIDWTLSKKPASINEFVLELKKEKITTVIRENEQGFIYGMTFIDHRNKTVFNGSDLGKDYSAAGLKERISKSINEGKISKPNLLEKPTKAATAFNKNTPEVSQAKETDRDFGHKQPDQLSSKDNLLELLTNKERNDYRIPFDFIKKKKKRRKPKL